MFRIVADVIVVVSLLNSVVIIFYVLLFGRIFSIERNSLAGSESALKLSSTFSVADSVSHSDVLSVLSTTVFETMSSRLHEDIENANIKAKTT